jgi:hypothetical protein
MVSQGRTARPIRHRMARPGLRRRPARDHVRGPLVEVVHPRINRPALEWTLSCLVVEPVTEPVTRRAAALLADTGLHGHKYAMLSAIAIVAPSPVTIFTSDPEDLTALCGQHQLAGQHVVATTAPRQRWTSHPACRKPSMNECPQDIRTRDGGTRPPAIVQPATMREQPRHPRRTTGSLGLPALRTASLFD